MKLTQQGTEIDQIIQGYLDVIVESLRSEIKGLRGIVLGGGFGRGEGSVEDKNGIPTPVNDFELFLWVERKPSEKKINQAANLAVSKLPFKQKGVPFYHFSRKQYADTFYLDIKVFTSKDLRLLLPMIRYYELKNASYLIWGEDFRRLMPDFKVEDLPLAEGFRILLNRLAMLGLYFSPQFIKKGMSNAEKHGFMYIGGKSLVDIPTALLLLNQKFVPSYRNRAEVFAAHFTEDFPTLKERFPTLPELVLKATLSKFNPDFNKNINPLEVFLTYRNACFQAFNFYLNKMMGQKNDTLSAVCNAVFSAGKEYYGPYLKYRYGIAKIFAPLLVPILNFLYFVRLWQQKVFYPRVLINTCGPDLALFSGLLNLLFSINSDGSISRYHLESSRSYILKTYPLPNPRDDLIEEWDSLSQAFSNAYVLYFYLKIV